MWVTTQPIHTPTGIGTGVNPLRTSAPPRTSAIPHAIPTVLCGERENVSRRESYRRGWILVKPQDPNSENSTRDLKNIGLFREFFC
jgi:hypothetical protein